MAAEEHDVTAGSVLLSYHVARGSSVLAKSVTESRIKENMNIIELNSTDMEKLEAIHQKNGVTRFVYPGAYLTLRLLMYVVLTIMTAFGVKVRSTEYGIVLFSSITNKLIVRLSRQAMKCAMTSYERIYIDKSTDRSKIITTACPSPVLGSS